MLKTCSKCGATKPFDQFYWRNRSRGQRSGRCKSCQDKSTKGWRERNPERVLESRTANHATNAQREREQASAWNKANPERVRANHLRRRFKITQERFDAMLAAQGYACAICKSPEPGGKGTWHIDHDHRCCSGDITCGECIRALLCRSCNAGLGLFQDDADRLVAAAAYLLQFEDVLANAG